MFEEIMDLARDEFISCILHQATSSEEMPPHALNANARWRNLTLPSQPNSSMLTILKFALMLQEDLIGFRIKKSHNFSFVG